MRCFAHMLALFALVLAPAAMHRAEAAPAAAHHSATAQGHCGGSSEQAPGEEESGRGADCALACSAMPGSGAHLSASFMQRTAYQPARASFFAGTAPGSDPPPPRLS